MAKKTEPIIIDPTAPGGMSRKALTKELVDEHGYDEAQAKALSWPQAIDAVCQQRLAREAEVSAITDRIDVRKPEPQPLFIGMPGTRDYIFDGHMGTGPSQAERWIACTASLGAVRSFLETLTTNQQTEFAVSTLAARQGTTAHAVAETQAGVLTGRLTPEEAENTLLELTVNPIEEDEAYSEEMEGYVSEYVDFVRGFVDAGRQVLIEHKVTATVELLTVDADGERELHELKGSLDLGVVPTKKHPRLVVGDLKYGKGVEVDVERNPQIRIYAIGLIEELVEELGEFPEWLTDVDYYIIQPRLGGIKHWTESVDDLLNWRDEVLTKALTEALGGRKAGAVFNPGEVQCQWCPVRGSCPALIEHVMERGTELFDAVTEGEISPDGEFLETIDLLDNVTLGRYYEQARALIELHDAMKAEAQRRLYRGQQVPGFHLVNYSPPRQWSDTAEEAIQGLPKKDRDALYTEPTLVSPTQAEKILGKEVFPKIEHLVVKPEKRPVVAPENDRRSKWDGRPPEAMFDVEPEQ